MKKIIAMAISYPNVINKESEKILKLFEAAEQSGIIYNGKKSLLKTERFDLLVGFKYSARISYCNYIIGNVFCYNTACADYHIISDGNPW